MVLATVHSKKEREKRKILIYVPFHACVCAQGENLLIVHWQIIRSNTHTMGVWKRQRNK